MPQQAERRRAPRRRGAGRGHDRVAPRPPGGVTVAGSAPEATVAPDSSPEHRRAPPVSSADGLPVRGCGTNPPDRRPEAPHRPGPPALPSSPRPVASPSRPARDRRAARRDQLALPLPRRPSRRSRRASARRPSTSPAAMRTARPGTGGTSRCGVRGLTFEATPDYLFHPLAPERAAVDRARRPDRRPAARADRAGDLALAAHDPARVRGACRSPTRSWSSPIVSTTPSTTWPPAVPSTRDRCCASRTGPAGATTSNSPAGSTTIPATGAGAPIRGAVRRPGCVGGRARAIRRRWRRAARRRSATGARRARPTARRSRLRRSMPAIVAALDELRVFFEPHNPRLADLLECRAVVAVMAAPWWWRSRP